jgi:hypothetical protein
MGIPVKVNVVREGSRTAFRREDEQQSERSDAGRMIVQEVFGFVKRSVRREIIRSEAEELGRGFGVHSSQPLYPLLILGEEICFYSFFSSGGAVRP